MSVIDRLSVFREPNTETGGGRNSVALMFNSSVFVLILGNPGLPLGISMCHWPRVFFFLCRDELKPFRNTTEEESKDGDDCRTRQFIYLTSTSVV